MIGAGLAVIILLVLVSVLATYSLHDHIAGNPAARSEVFIGILALLLPKHCIVHLVVA